MFVNQENNDGENAKKSGGTGKSQSFIVGAGVGRRGSERLSGMAPLFYLWSCGRGTDPGFEQDLADKTVGETLLIRISIFRLHSYFQGLALPSLPVPAGQEIFFLQVRIVGVEAVSQRELIRGDGSYHSMRP